MTLTNQWKQGMVGLNSFQTGISPAKKAHSHAVRSNLEDEHQK